MSKKFISLYSLLLLFICSVLAFPLVSCKKYLDKKSDAALVTPNTLDDLQALLDDNNYMNANTPGLGETSADDYFVQDEFFNSFGDLDRRAYVWNVETYNYPNDWASGYFVVFNSNYCLDQLQKIEKTPGNEEYWNRLKGSALFYRAYYYLGLVWDFAKAYDDESSLTDPGIVLRNTSDFNEATMRATVTESYQKILTDLKQAAQYLQEIPTHVMRPSKAAAYGALARTYLSMRKYDSAFKYADAALQIKSDLLDYNSTEVDPVSYVPFAPFNKEIIFYSTQSGNYTAKLYFYASIDTMLLQTYAPTDLRLPNFFFTNNNYYSFKGNYAGTLYPPFSGIATDEMLLTRAEGYARLGKPFEAMADVNTLLEKRFKTGTFKPLIVNTASEALDTILRERRKELVMRGLRWIDIKRLNKENYNIILTRKVNGQSFQLVPNSSYYALPLPADVIRQSGIPQN